MEDSQNVEEDSLMKAIKFYQSGLHRYMERNDELKMLHSLNKLSRYPIKVSHLKETGVGRTVNLLVKIEGKVGEEANSLINKWKQMVEKEKEDQDSSDDDSQNQTQYEEDSEGRYTHYKKSLSERKSDGDEDQYVKTKLQAEKENRSTEKHRTSNEHESNKANDHKRQESSDKYKHKSSHDRKENKHVVKSEREHSSRQDIEEKDGRSSIKKDRDNEKRREKDQDRSHKENGEKCKKGKDHKSQREKDKSSHREKERSKRSEKEERTHKEMDKNERREREEKQKEDKNQKERDRKSDDDYKKDRDKKSSSSIKKDKTSSSKNCRMEISSESGTSFADALGMMEIPRKVKKSDKKDSTSSSRHQRSDTVLESPIQEKKSDKKESSRQNKVEKSPKLGDSRKERKSDKKEGSKHHKSEISSESGTSFEDALGRAEITKREKKAIKRENSALYNSEICSSSGTSFEAALGMIEVPRKKKKFSDRQVERSPSPGEDGSPVLPLPTVPLDKIDLNISSLLPSITPNYRPIRVLDSKHPINELETLNSFMTNKHQRTKIYSGNKSYYAKVPSLFDICVQLLQVHIDAIEGTGGVPYSILKPVLDKASPNQLLRLEYYNSYLTEDSDELWQLHCQKDFRREKRAECETWREMYTRCTEERETRLLTLTANIKQSREKSVPVKQTKIAYIDPPSRHNSRRQVKHLGSAPMAKAKVESMVRESKASSDVVVTHHVKAARGFSSSSAPSGSAVTSSSQAKIKKVAPLMAKSLTAFKNRFKR